MAPFSSCVYLYFRQEMEKHLTFLRKHCRLCGKSVKRNDNSISSPVLVTAELHEKHAHASESIA